MISATIINLVKEFLAKNPQQPLIVILGPTATGKTNLAIKLAQKFNGEIISADSRAIYRETDLGTAKPTAAELKAASHHLVSVCSPDEPLTLVAYRELAEKAIGEVLSRGKLPILAGSHTLLISSIVLNYAFPEGGEPNSKLRQELEQKYATANGPSRLWEELNQADPATAAKIPPQNSYHLLRAVELLRTTGKPSQSKQKGKPLYDALLLGLTLPREELYARINTRVDAMMEAGLLDEVKTLSQKYDRSVPALRGHGYRELLDYLHGEIDLPTAVEKIKQDTRNYAKRQTTWWKNNPLANKIHWI